MRVGLFLWGNNMGDKLEKIKSESKWSLELSYSNDVRDFKIRVDFSSYERMTEIMKLAIIFNYIMMEKYPAERDSEINAVTMLLDLSDEDRDIICKKYDNLISDRMSIEMWKCCYTNKLYYCYIDGVRHMYTPDYTNIETKINSILNRSNDCSGIMLDIRKFLEDRNYTKYDRKKNKIYVFTHFNDYNNRIEINFENDPIIEITYWFQNDQLISHASINIINKNISKPFIDRLEVGIENIRKINKLEW